jgi:hypothetical protein
MEVHHENVDTDKLTFFELEAFVEKYGYIPCDLLYFKDPDKSLVDGLFLISLDYDVVYMGSKHVGIPIVGLYLVSFEYDGDGEGEDGEQEHGVRCRVELNGPWWDDNISDDDDVF